MAGYRRYYGSDLARRRYCPPGIPVDVRRAPADPGLGLRPPGGAAFLGLWLLLAVLLPVVVTGVPEAVGLIIGLLVCAGLGAFIFSLYGLHRQMVAVKDEELQLAREFYAEACP